MIIISLNILLNFYDCVLHVNFEGLVVFLGLRANGYFGIAGLTAAIHIQWKTRITPIKVARLPGSSDLLTRTHLSAVHSWLNSVFSRRA